MNPYFFAVGCSRSGTTLLKRMLDAHPKIAMPDETHWVPKLCPSNVDANANATVGPELIPALLGYHRFHKLGIGEAELDAILAAEPNPTYARFVSAIYDLYARRRGKELAGDKTPNYVRSIGLLHELWPHARFIHIVRDGRDVASSIVSWSKVDRNAGRFPSFKDEPMLTAACYWKWNVTLGRTAGARVGPGRYREIRYEYLVADPEAQSKAICDFLGVPFSSEMLRFHEGKSKAKPGRSAKKAWLPPTPGLRDWRSELSGRDIALFEIMAGDLLQELGYPLGGGEPKEGDLSRAEKVSRAFHEA